MNNGAKAAIGATAVLILAVGGQLLWLHHERNAPVAVKAPEREVIASFVKAGFEILEMSRLTVAEQISAMQSAAIVAGPAGANLANVAFVQPGTRILELFPPGWVHPYNWGVTAAVDGEFFAHVSGASEGGPLTIEGRYADFPVDLPSLEQMLELVTSNLPR